MLNLKIILTIKETLNETSLFIIICTIIYA